MHSTPQPCLSTICTEGKLAETQLYQRHAAAQVPDSPGAVLASLASSMTVPQRPKGFAPYHPLKNVQWNSSPAFQYLSPPQVSSKTNPSPPKGSPICLAALSTAAEQPGTETNSRAAWEQKQAL